MKRVCSILLCIALLLSLLPAAVLAGAAPALISTASLAMEPPAAGDTPESFAVTGEDGVPYAVDWDVCCLTTKQGSETVLKELYYSDDVFEADAWYFARIFLQADFGYQFADQVDVQVAGAVQSKVTENEGDYIEILAWFPVGSPAEVPTPITAVGADHVVEATVGSDARTAEEETESQAALTGDGYELSEVDYYKWVADSSHSYWSWTSGAFEAEQTYGVLLTLTAKPGYLFAQDVTASINGQSAQVMEWEEGTLEVFLPGDAITISYVEVTSDTWPIDGNPIDNTPDNFSVDSKTGYTLQFAEFQIAEDDIDGSWVYRSLTPEETTFSGDDHYRVYAVLQADDGAVFDASVTGSFNGASGTECTVSEDQKTCVVTRTCKVYDPVYTWNNRTYEEYNGVTFRLTTPAAGQTPENTTLYLTEGENYALYGVDGYYSWYEVPYAGSNRLIRRLSGTDAFEEGKVYLLRVDLDYKTGYRFAEGFTAEFLDMNGNPAPCARMETGSDTAKYKIYYLWYEVGEVNYQKVTDIVITGPAMGEDFSIPTNDLSAFTVAGGAQILSGFSYYGHLYLDLISAPGYYFGRQSELSVTYRVSGSDETYYGTINVNPYDHLGAASAWVVLNPVWPSGLAVCDKTYDASTDAQLDLSGVTLEGVAEGDDVYLDVSQVTAAFADKNVGTDKPVTLDGVLSLGGADAGRYLLVDPELALTANITPCTTVINTTTDVQNVTQGVGTFDKPHIVGMYGEPGTAAERIDTDTGAITYSCGTVKDGTYEQVVAYLKTLNKGDTAEIVYTFTGNANYQNATFTLGDVQTNTGKIKVTIVSTEPDPTPDPTPCDGGASCPSAHFTDEPKPGNWAHAGVDYAVANGLFNGMGPTTFEPNTPMTRAMLVTVLWRYEGQPVQGTNPFADVENGKWYTKPIAWASANGIVNGISADRFDPMGMVTREQLAAILYRYCGAKGIDNSARADLSAFPDVGSVSNYAKKAVSWAVAEGIIGGNKIDGVICIDPQGNATRAQVATIMMRFIENVVK